MGKLEVFAKLKRLPVDFLTRLGVEADGGKIRFANGDARERIRANVDTAHPTRWASGNAPMRVYGYDRVDDMRRDSATVLVVEGESDALTAWFHKRPALGVPGATMHDKLELEDVAPFDRVVVIREPDEAGSKFPSNVADRLREVGYSGAILVADLPAKDLSALHIAHVDDSAQFTQRLDAAIEDATPVESKETGSVRHETHSAFLSVGELLSEPDQEEAWLVNGLLRRGSLALVVAKPKVGKTTLALNLALSIARGVPCIGCDVQQGTVLYVALEGNRTEWRRVLSAMGATKHDALFIYPGQAPEGATEWLDENATRFAPSLIVVDTFQRFARLKDLNDYAAVTNALGPLTAIAQRTNATLVLPHHAKKNDADDGDAVLGSTAIFGAVDTLITLKGRGNETRTLSTVQRYGDSLDELVLSLNPETKLLACAGSKAVFDRDVCAEKIIAFLAVAEPWIERAELLDAIEGRKETTIAALQALLDEGRLTRTGRGKRGDPFRYALQGTLSPEDLGIFRSAVPRLYAEPRNGISLSGSTAVPAVPEVPAVPGALAEGGELL
jgi:hypothetical protein